MNKKKIFNDPVYGFISIHSELIYEIIDHSYFQRLRRIKQLGLTELIYPGALHTRFHHALGAMHLMGLALNTLRSKGHQISEEEYEAGLIAILLHDIGHGPFSHALEFSILSNISHEKVSFLIIKKLNEQFEGKLELALKIFSNKYERKFFHQLIESQLDIDRLDYLKRDCFFTGVSEGTVAADRIIKMLDLYNDELVIEEKGIYSIEHFLNARRLMYWQVYLHKTTVSGEKMLIQIIHRVKKLLQQGQSVFTTPALKVFLENKIKIDDLNTNDELLLSFTLLDDLDIWSGIKLWRYSDDKILSTLCNMLLNRKLFKVILSNERFQEDVLIEKRKELMKDFDINEEDLEYFFIHGAVSNSGYLASGEGINILMKNGEVKDVADASDLPNIKALSKIVKKYYVCFPKNVYLSTFAVSK
ncbi:MAG TPA: HD domain-containing protein [Cytophagales bacterium]|nr:HD domain-containing protein [Cytophagales bacterium]